MTKLILVEGIPGSGKTSAAQFINRHLSSNNHKTCLYLEGNLDHPADFESVACLDEGEYQKIKAEFSDQVDFLEEHASDQDGEYFFPYRKLAGEFNHSINPELFKTLARYEIYELPVDKFRRLLRQRWQVFSQRASAEDQICIFECAFLQNLLTMLLGANKESVESAKTYVLEIAEVIHQLNPRLIYLHPGDVETTLRKVAEKRPPEWLEFIIAYHTEQGTGKANGWQGFEGMIKFYELRQKVELELLEEMPFPTLTVHHTDWKGDYREIERFLNESS